MSRIIVPQRRVWTRQPSALVPVDRSHWAGRFCDLAYNGATNADHANLVIGSTSPSKIVRKEGIGPNTTSAGITLGPARGSPAKPFTLMVQAQAIAWGGFSVDWILHGYGGVAGCSFGMSAGGVLRLTFFGVADYVVGSSLYDGALPVKNYAVVVNGSTAVFYINGVYYNQATVGTPIATTSYAPIVQKAAAHPSSILPFAFRFGMAMSQGQIASLVDEPWQVLSRRDRYVSINIDSGGNIYTISPNGSISLLGSVTQLHERSITPSGSLALTGTNLITFTNGATTYTIIPSGSITLSGTNETNRYHLLVPQGNVSLSGNAVERRTRSVLPTGSIDFAGDATTADVKVFAPNGTVTFNGTAQLYMPGMEIESTKLPLTGVGS